MIYSISNLDSENTSEIVQKLKKHFPLYKSDETLRTIGNSLGTIKITRYKQICDLINLFGKIIINKEHIIIYDDYVE